MEQYIKKSDIVSEIESLKRSTFTNFDEGVNCVVQTLLEIIDTLEVKEVNDDKWLIKATEWLSANLHRYDESIGLGVEEFVERFKKAMKR